MKYEKHYIELLRIVNESSHPIRADNDYSDLDIKLFVELINEGLLKGTLSNPNVEKPTIMDLRPTAKGRKYQEELERNTKKSQQTRDEKISNKSSNWHNKPLGKIVIGVITALIVLAIVFVIKYFTKAA